MKAFIKQIFSDGNLGSFARTASGFTVLVASLCLMYQTYTLRHMPDGMTLTGLAAFATAPYTSSKVSGAIGKFGDKP